MASNRRLVLTLPSQRSTRDEIKHGLCGNVCRCAAYVRILDAVEAAAKGGRS